MKTVEFKEAEFYLGLNGVPFFFFLKSVHFSPSNYLGWCVGKQGSSLPCCHLGTRILSFVFLPSFVAAEPSASNQKWEEQPIARHSEGILSQSWKWHVRFLVISIPYMTKSNCRRSLEMRTSCLPRNKQRLEFGRWRA